MAVNPEMVEIQNNEFNLHGKYYVKKIPDGYILKKLRDIKRPDYIVGKHIVFFPKAFDLVEELDFPEDGIIYDGKLDEEDENAFHAQTIVERLGSQLFNILPRDPPAYVIDMGLQLLERVRDAALEGASDAIIKRMFMEQVKILIETQIPAGEMRQREMAARLPPGRPPVAFNTSKEAPPPHTSRSGSLNFYKSQLPKGLRLSGVPRRGGRRTRKSKPARKHKRYSRARTQSKHRK